MEPEVSAIAGDMPAKLRPLPDPARVAPDPWSGCVEAMYRFIAVRAGGDSHLAEDLLQQLWLAARRAPATLIGRDYQAWLRTVARNLIRTHWRTTRRRGDSVPLVRPELARQLSERIAGGRIPDEELERREVREQLLLAITELDSDDQRLIVGCYFEGCTLAQLALREQATSRAIEGRLYRARAALRERLAQLEV